MLVLVPSVVLDAYHQVIDEFLARLRVEATLMIEVANENVVDLQELVVVTSKFWWAF